MQREPKILLRMRDDLIKKLGVDIPPISEEEDEKLMKVAKEQNSFRFSEAVNEINGKAKSGSMYFRLLFNWATASSNYLWCWTWTWWWWTYTHCHGTYPYYAIYGWLWLSKGGHSKTEAVDWKGYFHWEQRISMVFIHWGWSPGEYKLEYSPDGSDKYTVHQDWISSHGGNWVWLARRYWWWSWRYWAWAQAIWFEEPVWIRIWRVLFRNPIYYYFGLFRVDTYSSDYNLQIRSMAQSDVHDCIVSESSHPASRGGTRLFIMDCLDAIALNDGRELWQYKKFDGVFYRGGLCWDAFGYDISEKGVIGLYGCHYSSNQRYYMFADGKIRILQDMNQCVTASGDKVVENVVLGANAEASSTIADTEHTPERIPEGKGDSYWASALGAKTAEFKVILKGPQVIKAIDIVFKYMPADFEIGGLTDTGQWVTFADFYDNSKESISVSIGARTVTALKILMKKHHPVSGLFKGKSVFGIVSIKAESVFKAIKWKKCDENKDSKTNVWGLDDMTFFDMNSHIVTNNEKGKTYANLNNLLPIINGVLQIPKELAKKYALAKEKRKNLNDIEASLKDLTMKLTMYQGAINTVEVKQHQGQSAIGSGSNNPASDCYVVLKTFPGKLSGYYWIQPDCGKNPIRVYCDFEQGSTPYAFLGSIQDGNPLRGISRPEHVQHYCAKAGLYPLEIRSTEMMGSLMRYIKDLGINLSKGDVIPLGFDYTCARKCAGRYQSLNAESSPDVSAAFTAYKDTQNVMNSAFKGTTYNSVGMGLNPGTVFYYNLDEFPIRGLMCSTNYEGGNVGYIKADCFTKARGNADFDGVFNTVLKVVCPPGCSDIKAAEVWGLMSYKDDSSVCRAAIHAGAIRGDEGGKVMIAIAPGKPFYDGGGNFGVESKPFVNYWDRSLIINPYTVRCPIEKFERKKSSFIEEDEDGPTTVIEPYFRYDNISMPLGVEGNDRLKAGIKDVKGEIDQFDRTNGGLNFLEVLNSTQPKSDNSVENHVNSMHYNKPPNEPSNVRPFNSKIPTQGSTHMSMVQDNAPFKIPTKPAFARQEGGSGSTEEKGEDAKADEKDESDADIGPAAKPKDTMAAKKHIERIYSFQNRDLKKAIKMMKEVAKLIDKMNTEMGPIQTTDISADSMSADHERFNLVAQATKRVVDKLTTQANIRVRNTERTLRLAKLEIMRLQIYHKYEEKYEFEVPEVYELTDYKSSIGGPSNWIVNKKPMSGEHLKSIAQTSSIRCNNIAAGCIGTMIALRYKRFHDAKMTFAFNSRDDGDIGVVFRLKDPFNYYIFEARNTPSFMRLRKVTNGVSKILFMQEGGISQNLWYNVKMQLN